MKNVLQRLKDFDNEIEDNVNGTHAYSVDDVEDADSTRKFEYNEYDDENLITTKIEPINDESSVSVESVINIKPIDENDNILLLPDISDNISPTPAPTPTSVSTLSDTEST